MWKNVLALGLCLLGTSAAVAQGSNSAGGFGNFGLSQNSIFGSTGITPTTAGNGGSVASGASFSQLGGNGFGSFDASFGASQLGSAAAGLAAASALSRTSSLGRGGFGGFGGGFGGFGGGGFGRGGFGRGGFGQNDQETTVRAVVRVGFPYAGPPAGARGEEITQRLLRIPLPEGADGVVVQMDGRTAVLTGQVATVETGNLIERIVTLEPGVDNIRNELTLLPTGETVPSPLELP